MPAEAASGPLRGKEDLKSHVSAPRKDPQHAVDLLRLLCILPGLSAALFGFDKGHRVPTSDK